MENETEKLTNTEAEQQTKLDETDADGIAFFDLLSDEIMKQILGSSLNERKTISRLRLVNKRWKELIETYSDLWKEKSTSHILQEIEKAVLLDNQQKEPMLKVQQFLKYWGVIIDYLSLILLIIFTALLSEKIEGGVDFTWYSVFIPLWIISFLSFTYIFSFNIAALKFDVRELTNEGHSLYLQLIKDSDEKGFKSAVNHIFSTYDTWLGRLYTWIYFLVILLFFIVLPIRLERGAVIISNKLLFAPMIAINGFSIFVAFFSCNLIPALLKRERFVGSDKNRGISKYIFSIVMLVTGSCLAAFFNLLWERLETRSHSWLTVLAPLYILFAIVLAGACIGAAFGLWQFCSHRDFRGLFSWCGCWILAFPCIVAFIITLGNRMENFTDVTYKSLFTPIFVLEGLGFFWLLCINREFNANIAYR